MGEDKSLAKVVIMECGGYDVGGLTEKINSGIEELGGWESFVKPGMTVLLKVNLISPKASDSAAITHCELVRAITRILKEKGCTVWIGDSSGGAMMGKSTTARSFEVSGIKRMAAEEGAIVKNFDREGVAEFKDEESIGGSMYLARPLIDADLVINLPKLKTHMLGLYTGAVKNLFGAVPGLRKAWYHRNFTDPESFGKVLAAINTVVRPGLHIMDGIVAMDGEGPTAGRPYKANKLLISTDPLALDSAACAMIGLDIGKLPMYRASIKGGIGEWRPENIKIAGDFDKPPLLKKFRVPNKIRLMSKPAFGVFNRVLDFLSTVPEIDPGTCKKCNQCVESCPMDAIEKESKAIDYTKCIGCMCCHELCTFKAVRLKKKNALARAAAGMFRRG